MSEFEIIQVLLIEDNPGDARLVKEALREETSTAFNLVWVDSLSKGLEYLGKNKIDTVLLDLSLPDCSGLATFERLMENFPQALIILLTGSDDLALAARAVQEGAQDYLIKGQVDSRLLVRSIRYAIERGRIGEALYDSEQKFRGLVESSIDGIVLIDENAKIIEWNAGEERITGLSRADVLSRPMWEIMYQVQPDHLKTPETYDQLKGILSSILELGQKPRPSQLWETDIYQPDGICRTIEMMFFVFKTNKGFRSGSITRDVTQRKLAEIAIRESESRYRSLFEDSPISMWEEDFSAVKDYLEELRHQGVTDFKTYLNDHSEVVAECVRKIKVLDINKATLKLYRAENKTDILDHIDKIINTNSYHTIGDELVGIAAGITSFEKEVVDHTLEGDKIVIKLNWTAAPGFEKSLSKVILSKIDITERKRAEAALRESEERLKLALTASRMGVWEWDLRSGALSWSPEAYTVTGLENAIYTEDDFNKMVAPQDYARDSMLVKQALADRTAYESEFRIVGSDPEMRWISSFGKATYADNGEPLRMVGTMIDITERKQAEGALARQTEELRYRNAELARLYRASETLVPGASYNLINLAQTIVEFVSREFASSVCSLFMVRNNSNRLDLVAEVGPTATQFAQVEFTLDGPGLMPQAIRTGQITTIAEVRSSPGYVPIWEETRSKLIAPLKIGDRVIGAIDVECPEPNGFNADDERLMSIFVERAALALEHARLYAETERRLNHLTALRTIDMAITNSFNLELTLNILTERLIQELGVHAADVLVYQPGLQILKFACGRGFRSHALQHTNLRLGEGNAGRAALERRLIHIPNLTEEPGGLSKSPELSGEGFVAYVCVPLIAKGQIKGVIEVFHRQPLALEQEWIDFLETLAGQAAIAVDNAELFDNLQHSNTELILAYDNTLAGWASALELRDKETEGHTQRVARMTIQLGKAIGLNEGELVHINRGALLHDIGKMGIPDQIMLKPGPLTDEEWVIMRKHPQYAYNMLSSISFLRQALNIPYCHHEKWDGTGYPRGLKGDFIPLSARIFSIVDVWDALLSDRPYRKAWPRDKVLEYIKSQAGTHFDPQVVDAFLKLDSN